MAIKTFGGGGGGGQSDPQLMALEDDTIYLGRVVSGEWADVKGTVPTHTLFNEEYTFDTNVEGAQGVILPTATGKIEDPTTNRTALQLLHTFTVEMVASMWTYDGSQTGVLMAGSGEDEEENVLYTVRIQTADAVSQEHYYEYDAGTNASLSGDWEAVRRDDAGPFHHWATTVASNGDMAIYCDGALTASANKTLATGGTAAQLAIGSYGGSSGTQWNGVIRDVRISTIVKDAAAILSSANLALGV
jgi:hypothetical protein